VPMVAALVDAVNNATSKDMPPTTPLKRLLQQTSEIPINQSVRDFRTLVHKCEFESEGTA
jgi:hypothetical protein